MIEFNKVFVDTAPFIYLLEKSDLYLQTTEEFFNYCLEHDKAILTSVITVEEYSVMPYRDNNTNLVADFQRLISATDTEVLCIDEKTADKAAQIRAKYKNFKAMDSLQLATAVINGADLFLTNDKQLKQFAEINVFTVGDLQTD